MAINKAHQWALSSTKKVTFADYTGAASTTVDICELPGDAIIVGVSINVEEAAAGAGITDVKGTLQFAAAGGDVALSAATDLDATGSTFAAPSSGAITGEVANVELDVALTGGTAPTAGIAYVTVLYVREDRANELRG